MSKMHDFAKKTARKAFCFRAGEEVRSFCVYLPMQNDSKMLFSVSSVLFRPVISAR